MSKCRHIAEAPLADYSSKSLQSESHYENILKCCNVFNYVFCSFTVLISFGFTGWNVFLRYRPLSTSALKRKKIIFINKYAQWSIHPSFCPHILWSVVCSFNNASVRSLLQKLTVYMPHWINVSIQISGGIQSLGWIFTLFSFLIYTDGFEKSVYGCVCPLLCVCVHVLPSLPLIKLLTALLLLSSSFFPEYPVEQWQGHKADTTLLLHLANNVPHPV